MVAHTTPSRTGAAEVTSAPAPLSADALHFEGFTILRKERRLLVGSKVAKIGARAFDLLLTLVCARDRVVGKDELLERVWPGLVVEENNLSVHVSQLRKLCGSHAISTVPGRGYQFTAASIYAAAEPRSASASDYTELQASPLSASQGNMPAHLPTLIGREAELRDVLQMLQDHRWVTITGAGGMGKTRLAEAAGQAMADQMPTWIVELAAVSDTRFVANAIAQVMGVAIVDTERPLEAICMALQGQPTLLILDNCEHLMPAVTVMCDQLMRQLPLLRVLVTSQELLRGADETVFKLGPLGLPSASNGANVDSALQAGSVRLLRDRVRALSRHFEITRDNLGDAITICQQLDGLPLAIELAAGRVPMLGLSGVRARLGALFRLLTGDARVRLRRHQTLRAALDWSYQLLLPAEQVLLRRLGVFAGSFSADGVRQLAADLYEDEWDVLDTLGSLIDKSMVQVKGMEQPRYQMLETARAYALEQLANCDETHDALSRHARGTREVCARAIRRRDTAAIWEEIPNIRAAFSWAMRSDEAELAVGLVNDSSVVLALGGLVGEVVQRLVEVEPCVSDRLPRPLAAQYWQWLGRFGNDGRLPAQRCVMALQTAEAMYRELCNDRHVHACLRMRAEALVEQGDLAGAKEALACARCLEQRNGAPADRMRRLRIEAKVLDSEGEAGQAIDRLEEALAMARQADIHRYIVTLTQDIGQVLMNAGDWVGAATRFRAVLDDQGSDLSVMLAVAYARMGLASALLGQGDASAARAAALEAVPLLRSCGILLAHAEAFAWLLAALGHPSCAATMVRTADAFRAYSQTARGPSQARARKAACDLLQAQGHDLASSGAPVRTDFELAQALSSTLSAPAAARARKGP